MTVLASSMLAAAELSLTPAESKMRSHFGYTDKRTAVSALERVLWLDDEVGERVTSPHHDQTN